MNSVKYKRACYHDTVEEVCTIAVVGLAVHLREWLHEASQRLGSLIDIYLGGHDVRSNLQVRYDLHAGSFLHS